MSKEIIARWIHAGQNIALDPNAQILCPVCQKVYLEVTDIISEKTPSVISCRMLCPECGACNELRLTR